MTPEKLAHESGQETIREGDIVICGLASCGLRPRLTWQQDTTQPYGLNGKYLSANDPDALCPALEARAALHADEHDMDAVDGV